MAERGESDVGCSEGRQEDPEIIYDYLSFDIDATIADISRRKTMAQQHAGGAFGCVGCGGRSGGSWCGGGRARGVVDTSRHVVAARHRAEQGRLVRCAWHMCVRARACVCTCACVCERQPIGARGKERGQYTVGLRGVPQIGH